MIRASRWFVAAEGASRVPSGRTPRPRRPRPAGVSSAQLRAGENVARIEKGPAGSRRAGRLGPGLPGAAALGPPLLGHLVSPPDGQRARRDVLGDDRAGADVGVVADGERRDQARVRPDERPGADLRLVLRGAVVVARDRPRPDVRALADGGVPEIADVVGLDPAPDGRRLDLDEV